MSDNPLKKMLKHPFEIHASQATEDAAAMEEDGYFTPDLYFNNTPDGLWSATTLRRFIVKMGYAAEVALDPVQTKKAGLCLKLEVGQIPQHFLEDIKDFMTMREAETGKPHFCLWMDENGCTKGTDQTAMWHAFQSLKKGGAKPHQ